MRQVGWCLALCCVAACGGAPHAQGDGGAGGAGGADGSIWADAGGAGGAPAAAGSCPAATEPVLIAATPTATYTEPGAAFVAVDGPWVNFTESAHGKVSRVARCGGTVEVLASNRVEPLQIVADADDVYWADTGSLPSNGQLLRMSKTGGTVDVMADALRHPWGVAVDASTVYVSVDNGIWAYPKTNPGAAVELTSSNGSANIALDSSHVYWPVGRVPKAGGPSTQLATPGRAWCVAVDADSVYWTEYGGPVSRVSTSGGAVTAILPDEQWRCLTVDEQYVYAASDIGVVRALKDGSGAVTFSPGGEGIVADDQDVFYANKQGVWRLSK